MWLWIMRMNDIDAVLTDISAQREQCLQETTLPKLTNPRTINTNITTLGTQSIKTPQVRTNVMFPSSIDKPDYDGFQPPDVHGSY